MLMMKDVLTYCSSRMTPSNLMTRPTNFPFFSKQIRIGEMKCSSELWCVIKKKKKKCVLKQIRRKIIFILKLRSIIAVWCPELKNTILLCAKGDYHNTLGPIYPFKFYVLHIDGGL